MYGVKFSDGTHKSYPRKYLVEEGQITDSVNDQSIELVYRDGFLTISGDAVSKLVPAYWYAWAAIQTETELYDPLGQLTDTGL